MKNNFEYWINNSARNFIVLYWLQYAFFYFLAIGLALKTKNPYAFFIIGFIPYLAMLIFRGVRSPFSSLENGIKTNDISLYQRLVNELPQQYNQSAKYRAGYFLSVLLKEPEAKLNSAILAFKKNYYRINSHAIVSLVLWFSTFIVLLVYLYIDR